MWSNILLPKHLPICSQKRETLKTLSEKRGCRLQSGASQRNHPVTAAQIPNPQCSITDFLPLFCWFHFLLVVSVCKPAHRVDSQKTPPPLQQYLYTEVKYYIPLDDTSEGFIKCNCVVKSALDGAALSLAMVTNSWEISWLKTLNNMFIVFSV